MQGDQEGGVGLPAASSCAANATVTVEMRFPYKPSSRLPENPADVRIKQSVMHDPSFLLILLPDKVPTMSAFTRNADVFLLGSMVLKTVFL